MKLRIFRKKKKGTQFQLEKPVSVSSKTRLTQKSFIGKYSHMGNGLVFGDIRVGRFCSIANDFTVISGNHPMNYLSTHPFAYNNQLFGHLDEYRDIEFKKKKLQAPADEQEAPPLIIGNDVWIGTKAIILGKVKSIENGAIVGAGSIVTKDVPPYAIVAGNPARILGYRFDPPTIDALERLKWWELPLPRIKHLDFADVTACIEELEKIRLSEPLKAPKKQELR